MRSSTAKAPVRVGLSATFSMVSSLSSSTAAITARKAADDGSPGALMSWACRRAGPVTLTVRPSTSTGTPKAGSRRSVWSRLLAGSVTLVVPPACRPASSTALLTWADALGLS